MKNVSFLLVQEEYLSHGSFISYFQEEKGRLGCFSGIYNFSSAFSSKSSLHGSEIVWSGILCHLHRLIGESGSRFEDLNIHFHPEA